MVKAIHGYNPLLKNGGQVFENVGYIIDDGSHRLYTTSDTICFNNDYKADVVIFCYFHISSTFLNEYLNIILPYFQFNFKHLFVIKYICL